jgi:hypothetical protein
MVDTRLTALYPGHLPKRDLERLTTRAPGESYSDTILRRAKLETEAC